MTTEMTWTARKDHVASRWLLGALTCWPLVWMAIFIASVGLAAASPGAHPWFMEGGMFPVFFGLHFLTALLSLGLTAVFIVMAAKHPRMTTPWLLMWVALFLALNVFAFPIFWLVYVRPGARDEIC